MTKTRIARPAATRKATKSAPSEPPSERIQKNLPPVQRQKVHDSKGNAHVGAKISRRAADRLRAGHLWVYASDIESVEVPAASLLRCCWWLTAVGCF